MTFASAGLPVSAEPFKKPSPHDEDEAIDLGGYVRMLWGYRVVIAGTVLLCGAALAALALSGPRKYEAATTVILSQSKIGERMEPAAVSMATFQPLLQSHTMWSLRQR